MTQEVFGAFDDREGCAVIAPVVWIDGDDVYVPVLPEKNQFRCLNTGELWGGVGNGWKPLYSCERLDTVLQATLTQKQAEYEDLESVAADNARNLHAALNAARENELKALRELDEMRAARLDCTRCRYCMDCTSCRYGTGTRGGVERSA